MIKPQDAERAQQVLCEHAGMRAERPPEGWLLKAWDGEILVDLIFGPSGMEMTDEVFERGETLPVLAMDMPVMAMEDMLATKLHAMTEHHLAFEGPLRIARALREQIDWQQVRERTSGNPFAAAFFTLVEELGVVEREAAADAR
jgi:hypothetical protein